MVLRCMVMFTVLALSPGLSTGRQVVRTANSDEQHHGDQRQPREARPDIVVQRATGILLREENSRQNQDERLEPVQRPGGQSHNHPPTS